MQGLDTDISNGGVQFSLANNGMAVYLSGAGASQSMNLVLFDRKGNATVLLKDQPDAASPSLSPDGKKLAFEKGSGGIWIYDLARGTTSPLHLRANVADFNLIWTPDGQRITYSYTSGTGKDVAGGIYWNRADGLGKEQQLTQSSALNSYPSSWSPDGKVLAFKRNSLKDGVCCDIWILHIGEDGKPQEPQRFIDADHGKGFTPAGPSFSPDGRWLAYSSVDSGQSQIYVVPFPSLNGRWQVSTDGGVEPHWSRSGHELFYLKNLRLMAVPYSVEKNVFQPGKPQILFQEGFKMRIPFNSYDVSADGQHFAMLQSAGRQSGLNPQPIVVLNWLDDVRRQVVAGQSTTPK